MAVGAIKDAADEDRGTGGVDVQRGIYPRVKLCGPAGVQEIPDDEVARAHRQVLEQRARRG